MARVDYKPNGPGMGAFVRSPAVERVVMEAANRGAAAASQDGRNVTVRPATVTVLGRWGGPRAGAIIEADGPGATMALRRAVEVIERGR